MIVAFVAMGVGGVFGFLAGSRYEWEKVRRAVIALETERVIEDLEQSTRRLV